MLKTKMDPATKAAQRNVDCNMVTIKAKPAKQTVQVFPARSLIRGGGGGGGGRLRSLIRGGTA